MIISYELPIAQETGKARKHTRVPDDDAVAVAAVEMTTTPTIADVDAAPTPFPGAIDPLAGIYTSMTGIPSAFSFCVHFITLARLYSLLINLPPGVPGIAPLPFLAPVSPLSALAPVPVAWLLSSSVGDMGAGAGGALALPFDADGRGVGTVT
jgi:hypothetical protein